MYCLHCGDCCRMSPLINDGDVCTHLIAKDTFYFCGNYRNRPEQCKNHIYSFARFCPVGMSKLKLTDSESVRVRIEKGWEMINNNYEEVRYL